MKIGESTIGPGAEPYVIAEVSGNHGGSFDQALELIDAAKWTGADAVKMQLFTPETMTIDSDAPEFVVEKGIWKGKRLWDIYAETATPADWFPKLHEHAASQGLHFFSSVFDLWGLQFAVDLGLPVVKIASNELTHWPLLEKVGESGLPALLSTGGSSLSEIISSANFLIERSKNWVLPFYCVSAYPAELRMLNLAGLPHLSEKLSSPLGFSDHSIGDRAAAAAVALGAVAVEKHIKLERDVSSPDAAFSATPSVFRRTVQAVRETHLALGNPRFGLSRSEENAPILKRRYYAAREIKAGSIIGESDLLAIRARSGIPSIRYIEVIGSRALENIPAHTPLSENQIERRI